LKSDNKKLKPTVLIASHIGFPIGGISINYQTLMSSSLSDRLSVQYIETSKGNFRFSERGGFKFSNAANALVNLLSFIKALRFFRPDVVHIGTAYGPSFIKHGLMALAARLADCVVIMQFHCHLEKLYPTKSSFLNRFFLMVTRWCDGLIVLSSNWVNPLKSLTNCAVVYIPNAIHTRIYAAIPREKCPAASNKPRILYLGHIGYQKGIFDLIDAVQQVAETTRNFSVDLVGEELALGELQTVNQAIHDKSLDDLIHIHPPEYDEKKFQRFKKASIYVLPSHHEGMPMSILEAMAAGLPVVATDVGGIRDQVLDGETGFIVPSGSVKALSEALKQLILDEDKRLAMGAAGRARAQECFDIENKVDALISLYRSLFHEKNEPKQIT